MTRISRPSVTNQRRLTGTMQLVLVGFIAYGLLMLEPKTIMNGSFALVITFLPALFERNYKLPLDPWLSLWITSAVFLHTLGSAGLYGLVFWWDNLTHALSASLIAAIGYTTARAIDLHSDDIYIPTKFAFVYILVIVLSFGVIWELFEYALDVIAMETGLTMPLAQHGLTDTVRDLVFNSIGALIVAVFGQVHLSGLAETLRHHLLAPD